MIAPIEGTEWIPFPILIKCSQLPSGKEDNSTLEEAFCNLT